MVELYACRRYCKGLQEGPPNQFFIRDLNDDSEYVNGGVEEALRIPAIININSNNSELELTKIVYKLRNQGFFIDNDNIPVPDNIPDAEVEPSSTNESQIMEW